MSVGTNPIQVTAAEWNAPSWTQVAAPFTAETSAAYVYGLASVTDGVLLGVWGTWFDYADAGFNTRPPLGSGVWKWDGSVWTKLSDSAAPSSGTVGSPAFVCLNGWLVLYDGQATMLWNGSTWAVLAVQNPPTRLWFASTIENGHLIVFGGTTGASNYADTWSWDGRQWSMLASSGPPARTVSAMATLASTVVLFGGSTSPLGGPGMSDTWQFDGSAWTELHPATIPPARWNHAMGSYGGKIIMYGDSDSDGAIGSAAKDTWVFDGTDWSSYPATSSGGVPVGPPVSGDVMAAR